MEKERDSFIFYRSFWDAIEEANDEQQLMLYRAIARYGLDEEEPQLTGMVKAVWLAIRPQLAANWRKFRNGCNAREHGVKGGAPKGNQNARKNNPKTTPKQPQNNPKTTANVECIECTMSNDECIECSMPNDEKRKRSTFTPPTIDEINKFLNENEINNVDSQRFFDFYESKGWMVGKNKMKDWKAAIRNWSRDARPNQQTRRTSSDATKYANDIWGTIPANNPHAKPSTKPNGTNVNDDWI